MHKLVKIALMVLAARLVILIDTFKIHFETFVTHLTYVYDFALIYKLIITNYFSFLAWANVHSAFLMLYYYQFGFFSMYHLTVIQVIDFDESAVIGKDILFVVLIAVATMLFLLALPKKEQKDIA